MTSRAMEATKWHSSIVPTNCYCWAICTEAKSGARKVRKIVWGRLLARYEKRHGEIICRAMITTRVNN